MSYIETKEILQKIDKKMYDHINSTTAGKGKSKTVQNDQRPIIVHHVNPYRGYPSWDGEDVICCNCGHILGWSNQKEMPTCPACGCQLDWKGFGE